MPSQDGSGARWASSLVGRVRRLIVTATARVSGVDAARQSLAANIDQCTEGLLAQLQALRADLERVSETSRHDISIEIHRNAEYLDGQLHVVRADLERGALENRSRQNQLFSRDNLPSALAVKSYFQQLKAAGSPISFDDAGLSVFSQNNEDGILMYIFSLIGMTSRRSIEIGCDLSGSTIGIPEGNTINLIVNFAFDGLIVDIDPAKASAIRHFFARALTTQHHHAPSRNGVPAHFFSPAILAREVRVDNIDDVFRDGGFTGEIDLLSIDTDGEDVRMWLSVEAVSPRVVVIEVNPRIPFEDVVYGTWSQSSAAKDSLEYQSSMGSSLAAAYEVAGQKGYVFVGMDATLINAFFVRRDVWTAALPERRPENYTAHRMNPLKARGVAAASLDTTQPTAP